MGDYTGPTMSEIYGFDAFAPKEIAARVESIGVAKARLPLLPMFMLGVLAGAFIGVGTLFSVLVRSDPSLGFAARQLLSGGVFSLGLLMVVVAGAELFTGNNLLAIAWAERKITTRDLLRNWLVVCTGNFVGAAGLAWVVAVAGTATMNEGAVGAEAVRLAVAKAELPLVQAFARGVLCNVLVCIAVWMALAGRSVVDKVAAIVLPVAAFVAAGFEHCIANMFTMPLAMLLQRDVVAYAQQPLVTLTGLLHNLLPVIAGNIVGGSVLVGLVYRLIYRRSPAAGDGT